MTKVYGHYGGAAVTDLAAAYERTQNFNAVTRWLHGQRYRHSLAVVAELAPPRT